MNPDNTQQLIALMEQLITVVAALQKTVDSLRQQPAPVPYYYPLPYYPVPTYTTPYYPYVITSGGTTTTPTWTSTCSGTTTGTWPANIVEQPTGGI